MLISPHGNDIRTFALERTVCDVLRSRNRIDFQQVNEVLKRYVKKKEKDLDLLYQYARQFGIQKIVREYIEVLLWMQQRWSRYCHNYEYAVGISFDDVIGVMIELLNP